MLFRKRKSLKEDGQVSPYNKARSRLQLKLLSSRFKTPSHKKRLTARMLPGFDENYYLHWYPDVKNSNQDPLWHYLSHGWLERRDPSAGFSTAGYLRANPDVARTGENPLLHYLNDGLAEGRRGFEKDPMSPAPRPTPFGTHKQLLPSPNARRYSIDGSTNAKIDLDLEALAELVANKIREHSERK